MLSTIGQFLAGHAIAMFMLSVGLRTNTGLLRQLFAKWPFVARALTIVWLAVPLLALTVLIIFRPSPTAAISLMVIAICPGLPIVVRKAKQFGDADTSLIILVATAVTALVMIPLWATIISRLAPVDVALSPREIGDVLVPVVLVPLGVGMIVNEVMPRIAPALAKVANTLFVVGVVILVIAVLTRSLPAFRELLVRDFVAALLIPLASAFLGFAAAGASREDRISTGYAAALGNPMLAITAIAHTTGPQQFEGLPIVGAFLLLRIAALIPFNQWLKHRYQRSGEAPTSDVAHAHGR